MLARRRGGVADRAVVEDEELLRCGAGARLFPTFALIAHYIVGTERTAADLRATALFGLWSLLPYAVYLMLVYWLSVRLGLTATLLCATLAWVLCAAALLLAWPRVFPSP